MKRTRLTSDPQKAREWEQRSRGSLGGRSAKRAAQRPLEQEVILRVVQRDRRCVLAGHPDAGPCFGPLTPHHLRKQSQGGTWTMRNLVTLCAAMNSWVEDYPRKAHELGLVIRHGETEEEAWEKMRAAGLVSRGHGDEPTVPTESPT